MFFTKSTIALAALAATAHAHLSGDELIKDIESITTISHNTNNIAQSMSVTNFFSSGPGLVQDLKHIVEIATHDATEMAIGSTTEKRQVCLNVEQVEDCEADLMSIAEDPTQLERRSAGGATARASLEARLEKLLYDVATQKDICKHYGHFLDAQERLSKSIIGKHGLIGLTPFTRSIRHALRAVEAATDRLTIDIVDATPSCGEEVRHKKISLDRTLKIAISTYES